MKSFTLIEILISVAIFMVMLLAFQAFISSAFSTELRALAMRKLADETRTALEIMGREMRLAQEAANSVCIQSGKSYVINNDITATQGGRIEFIDYDGRCITYNFNAGTKVISKKINSNPFETFLGGNIRVAETNFLLISGAGQQPRIVIRTKVQAVDPSSPNQILEIPLETTISQREINL